MKSLRTPMFTAVLVAGGVLTACGSDDGAAPGPTTAAGTTPAASPASPATSTGPAAGAPVDARGAAEAALAAQQGATVIGIDDERDIRKWEVTLVTAGGDGVELLVDMADGSVSGERPTTVHPEEVTPPRITAVDAVSAALAERPGTLTELDYDRDHGRMVWEASVRGDDGAEWEIDIDPDSGDVIAVDRD
jgi:hypothetical protein